MSNPGVYTKLQSVIDNAIRSKLISSPIRDSEALQIPYLIAVIREGLRMHPPAIAPFCKVAPPQGDTIDGYYIPGGTSIGACQKALQRNKDVFGPDADAFRPERWLEADEETLRRMEKTVDLVFGWGRYQCLGKTIAWIELKKVFVEVCSLPIHHAAL
jgi:cytochrome P450